MFFGIIAVFFSLATILFGGIWATVSLEHPNRVLIVAGISLIVTLVCSFIAYREEKSY